ncbi:hypothetical protein C2S51_011150 [Perilla frutescens var. frutescens]|nr:hypothetical protein C2S51_011150 [Perilla frutescens var. frutescens]
MSTEQANNVAAATTVRIGAFNVPINHADKPEKFNGVISTIQLIRLLQCAAVSYHARNSTGARTPLILATTTSPTLTLSPSKFLEINLACNMEEQNHRSYLQGLPLENDWIANNASGLPTNFDSDQPCIMAQGSGVHLGPVPVHQWMHYQPTPENYVQFLDETVYPEMQKQMSYNISAQLPTLGLPNPYQLEEYMRPHDGGDFVTTVTGLEQLGFQKQKWNEECSYDFETYSQSAVAGSKELSKVKRKRSRQRAYSTDRYRRLRISHGLDALQELVPHPEGAGQGALLDGVIDHIKYLQYQMKDLCQNRLGGESTSNSVIFLEEHGHYFVQDQMLNGPLEEMIGKLIDVYPSAATELLQSRGLIVLPMNFAEGLLESTDMLDMQEQGGRWHLWMPARATRVIASDIIDGH